MYKKYLQRKAEKSEESSRLSSTPSGASLSTNFLLRQSKSYLSFLEDNLFDYLDKRISRTFFDLFIALLLFRDQANGLVLSELGGYISGFDKAPAGTKRLSNLLGNKYWSSSKIDEALFERAKERIKKLKTKGKHPLFLWDDSRIEKPESWFSEGLCSVFSSKGKRLTKIIPIAIGRGFFRPPSSRICVPGYQ